MTEPRKSEDVPDALVFLGVQSALNDWGDDWDGIAWTSEVRQFVTDALAEVLPVHEKQIRAKVADEQVGWLTEVLHIAWTLTLGQDVKPRHAMEALKEVPITLLESADIPGTWPPEATGDTQNRGREHGEGSRNSEASQGRSASQGEEA